jgi:anion-transporting  ArsA/GET3 family ATPase
VKGSEELTRQRRIVVCVGMGGVGKTTVAASLALGAARLGRRALVITIDPARRLANALGIEELDNEPRGLAPDLAASLGIAAGGDFQAMMLDMKRTFDDMVTRFAESDAVRDRILENSIYQHISDALAGSAEYAAMEKVYEVAERDDFDLIVVDTPPSQHALDFLEAPERLMEFLDSRMMKTLLRPAFSAGRFGLRIFQRGTQRVLALIERVSGLSFLESISEFLLAFEGMSEGFRERARHVQALLMGPSAGFVLVAGPTPESSAASLRFLTHLEESQVPLAGLVLNRVREWPGRSEAPSALLEASDATALDLSALARALEELCDAPMAETAARAAVDVARGYAALVALDERSTAPLRERASQRGLFVQSVAEFEHDVHDLEGLDRVARILFGPAQGEIGS